MCINNENGKMGEKKRNETQSIKPQKDKPNNRNE